MNTRNHSQRCQGFTLIELLVVIAIILILAAILFPVFARARENARRTSCLSNQKQLGLGFMQYAQDYDERLPGYTGTQDPAGGSYTDRAAAGWAFLLQPYIKSSQVLQCPSEPRKGGATPTADYSDYIYNSEIGCSSAVNNCDPLPVKSTALAEFTLVANTAVTWDGASDGSSISGAAQQTLSPTRYTNWYLPNTAPTGATGPLFYAAATRHLEGLNFLFADGHVKWLTRDKITPSTVPGNGIFTLKIK